ncbi:phycobiliprotein lyase [Phormidium sp. CCY1219]|uniref:phycobiliprotein lyase n=1 Tax=Phormidium sp. CCY1219 TaxID=2886104 RepID=UPI002D1F44D4|nr:phycobiliprotein lyase [Phormidium sp. CCY1219]MEB3828604.1 phycobiliprotein lyase [Phormidium sp. CCY1219]
MDIIEFFDRSAGKWFSQRTRQDLVADRSTAATTDLWIDPLSTTETDVVQLCQQQGVDPADALCAARIRWESKPMFNEPKESGATILVPLGDRPQSTEGKLLHQPPSPDSFLRGRFLIGSDDAVTLIAESDTLYAEERIWFASENLRLRTSIVKQPDGFSKASFYSEIRMKG